MKLDLYGADFPYMAIGGGKLEQIHNSTSVKSELLLPNQKLLFASHLELGYFTANANISTFLTQV